MIFIKIRNKIKDVNINRLLYIYINKRILNRLSNSYKKKLLYIYRILLSNEQLAKLKNLILRSDDMKDDFDYVNINGKDNYEVTAE